MKRTILMIEDDPNITRINRTVLTKRGYRVLEAETLECGRKILKREIPDLVILDIILPDGSGLDFCEEIREKNHIPILFLTALVEDQDIVNGFDRGGDDYLPKPYAPNVLAARVEGLLRRAGYAETFARGAITLDVVKHQACVNGERAALTPIQFSLLLYLIRHEGRVMPPERLYKEVWGQPMSGDDNALKTAVSHVRKKIRPAGFQIAFVRGSGYRFEECEE